MTRDELAADKVIAQVHEFRGNVTSVARYFHMSRQTLYAYIKTRPSVQAAIEEARESMIDNVESALYTAAHHKIPLLIVMHNNQSFYNSEDHNFKIAQHRARPVEGARIGTHVDNPPVDYKKVAEGFGVYSVGPIRKAEDVRPALEKALAVVKNQKLPALVDVVSEPR